MVKLILVNFLILTVTRLFYTTALQAKKKKKNMFIRYP